MSEKVNLLNTDISIKIEKSKQPIIFLDSNIIIEINKIILKKKHDKKIEKLFDLLKIGVNEFCIQTPIANQEIEVDYGETHRNNINVLWKLSRGNKFKNTLEIEDIERKLFFEFMHKNETNILLDYKKFFDKIDIKSPIINIFIKEIAKLFDKDIVQTLSNTKTKIADDLEIFCTNNREPTFRKQFRKELTSEGEALYQIVYNIQHGEKLTPYQKEIFQIYKDFYLHYEWTDDVKLRDFCDFILGEYWFEIPYIYIGRSLLAYVIFNRDYKASDYFDIDNASHYLPFCNYYYTDKRMANILKHLQIDKKYNTKVFSYKNIDELINDLEKILGITK